jgi:rare lipoprotein A
VTCSRSYATRAVLFALPLLLAACSSHRVANRPPAPPPSSTQPPTTNDAGVTGTPSAPKRGKNVPPAVVGWTEEGNASWYGNPFNGRRSSNGEVYDMYKLTAAHRTLPFETMVRVTNLSNGKSTVVRITDRGPFVDNRIIDLSLAAAREVESVGPGVVPVRLEVLGNVDVTRGFFTVQIGAFRDRGNAERLRDRLSASYNPIFIQEFPVADGMFYRVRVGKISGEDPARQLAEQLHTKDNFTTFVVRLDEPTGGK